MADAHQHWGGRPSERDDNGPLVVLFSGLGRDKNPQGELLAGRREPLGREHVAELPRRGLEDSAVVCDPVQQRPGREEVPAAPERRPQRVGGRVRLLLQRVGEDALLVPSRFARPG